MALARKVRRFAVFFSCLYLVYLSLNTINKSHRNLSAQLADQGTGLQDTSNEPSELHEDASELKVDQHAIEDTIQQMQDQVNDAVQINADNLPPSVPQAQPAGVPAAVPASDGATGDFFERLFDIYMQHFPQTGPIRQRQDSQEQLSVVNIDDEPPVVFSEKYLSDHLDMDDKQYEELRQKHQSVVAKLSGLEVAPVYSGDGIVMVSHKRHDSVLLILGVVAVLREELHFNLPIEVMTLDDTGKLCDTLLSSKYSNVTCTPLLHNFSDKIKSAWNFDDENWFKNLALLNSHFQRVLYLDPTTIPVEDPTELFNDAPFTKYGLVLWPDYWRRMSSPVLYKIQDKVLDIFRTRAGINEFITNTEEDGFFDRIALHDRGGTVQDGTTANDLVLIDKAMHFETLLLALYYTINGNDFYYPLISNFVPNLGNSEKETLAVAATFLDKSYYQVKHSCQVLGSWFNKQFNGVGIKQFNPIKDLRNVIIYKRQRGDLKEQLSNDKLAFVTPNNPNLDPQNLLANYRQLKDLDGSQIRLLGEDLTGISFDLELKVFEIYKDVICEQKIQLNHIENQRSMCKFLNLHLTHLKSSSKDLKLG